MAGHKTVKVPCPFHEGGEPIDIDRELAPLIRLLWAADIETCQCCEEYRPGLACIEFPGTAEVCEFLHVAQRDYHVELERWDEGEDGEHNIAIQLVVLFPVAEIPALVEAFEEYEPEE